MPVHVHEIILVLISEKNFFANRIIHVWNKLPLNENNFNNLMLLKFYWTLLILVRFYVVFKMFISLTCFYFYISSACALV